MFLLTLLIDLCFVPIQSFAITVFFHQVKHLNMSFNYLHASVDMQFERCSSTTTMSLLLTATPVYIII